MVIPLSTLLRIYNAVSPKRLLLYTAICRKQPDAGSTAPYHISFYKDVDVNLLRKGRKSLDTAALIIRQFTRLSERPSVLRVTVKPAAARIGSQANVQNEFCVPTIEMNVESYRRRIAAERGAGKPRLASDTKRDTVG